MVATNLEKPGILSESSKTGKVGIHKEFCAILGENCNKNSVTICGFQVQYAIKYVSSGLRLGSLQ